MPTKTKEVNEENMKKKVTSKNKTTKKLAHKKIELKNKSTINIPKSNNNKKNNFSKSNTKKITDKTAEKKIQPQIADIVEYYDLPYRYNETIVKVLYQTPDTLFVYWDIADSDRENYIKQYGEDFFNITRPVLIIYNDTMNYSFEIPINDFTNSWYLHINDSKCNYRVELGRRPNYINNNKETIKKIEENIKTDYIYVSSSNKIESPNDHVLFSTNENNTVKFRNIKNHEEKSVSLFDIVKHLPVIKKEQNIPYINKNLLMELYSGIYQNEDISLFERLSNPSSSENPSSGSMSSRFI